LTRCNIGSRAVKCKTVADNIIIISKHSRCPATHAGEVYRKRSIWQRHSVRHISIVV